MSDDNSTKARKDMVIATYDRIVQDYMQHEAESPVMEKYYLRFLHSLSPGSRILDAGCGPGLAARRFCAEGHVVTGIDLSERMLEHARSMAPEAAFFQMDVENISLTERFDAVWAAFILVHVSRESHEKVLRKFHDLLEPGGILYVGMLEGAGEKTVPEPFNPDLNQYFVYASEQQIRNSLLEAGFGMEDYSVDFDESDENTSRLSSSFARKRISG